MRFELVRERLASLPREMPEAPAILTPIRLDAPEAPFTAEGNRRGRSAAVLVLLFPDDEGQARVLLTARVAHGIQHAGEVSFPGGSAEPDDRDPIETSLREATEEVGLDPTACGLRVTGVLEVFALTGSGFRITPVVALAERRPECRAAAAEVARIIEAPVEAFLPDAPVELEERVIRQRLIRYGLYPVEGERVWGATARMLGQLGALLAVERQPRAPELDRQAEPGRSEPVFRPARDRDRSAIDAFLLRLAPELAHARPPASEMLVAELSGRIVGLASCAPWDRIRAADDPRGFDGLDFPGDEPAEFTLLAVAPEARGRGIGRRLTNAVAQATVAAGHNRLLAWTLADSDVHPSSIAARAFFRSVGFTDLAVDRRVQARGEDRLMMHLPLSVGRH